jgi:hypothetical protein
MTVSLEYRFLFAIEPVQLDDHVMTAMLDGRTIASLSPVEFNFFLPSNMAAVT